MSEYGDIFDQDGTEMAKKVESTPIVEKTERNVRITNPDSGLSLDLIVEDKKAGDFGNKGEIALIRNNQILETDSVCLDNYGEDSDFMVRVSDGVKRPMTTGEVVGLLGERLMKIKSVEYDLSDEGEKKQLMARITEPLVKW